MLGFVDTVKVITRVAEILMDVLQPESPAPSAGQVSEAVACADCETEAWVIRWGSIRIGQELNGFYAQSTVGGPPILLCRKCWHKRIGVDDPLTP